MDSGESYHSDSELCYPDEMTNENENEDIGAISNEENQQNVDVFTMARVKINFLAQRVENTVKRVRLERLEEVIIIWRRKNSWLQLLVFGLLF